MFNLELRTLIQSIVRSEFEQVYGVACKVLEVREDEDLGFVCDCEPLNGNAIIKDTRLQPQTGSGILIKPSIDSIVFVTMEDEFNGFVSMYGLIESIQFFSGTNGGLVKVSELVEKINQLEQTANTHTHPSNGAIMAQTPLIETTIEDLENPLITQ